MVLVEVPAGEFAMGAAEPDDAARDDERPRHEVRISRSFFLGAHEVTVGQFRRFVDATGFRTDAETDGQGASGYDADRRGFEYESARYSWRFTGYPQDDLHPVVNVDWHDAVAFCDWLSAKEGRRYRLPTEAEWEHACRGGASARFVVGEASPELQRVANAADRSLERMWDTETVRRYGLSPEVIRFLPWDDGFAFTAPVGSFEPTAFGLHDMLGNVGEFCSDAYEVDYYGSSPAVDPEKRPAQGDAHVVRGGTFLNGTSLVRASSRTECRDRYRNYVIGFRVALDLESAP